MLNINSALALLEAENRSIRVGVVGAGQMGTGLVAQISRMKGMRVVAVADIAVERSTSAFVKAGVPAGKVALLTSKTADTVRTAAETAHAEGQSVAMDRADWLAALPFVDVIVEATGVPEIGARVAEQAIAGRKHIVMLNAETDATVGFILKQMAAEAGVVYTGSAGDEPACAKELHDFADALGFKVLVAGKGKNNPMRLDATPDDLAADAVRWNASPKMLTSFVDGTKTMVEMTQLGNATGFVPDCTGMHGPTASLGEVLNALRLKTDGGVLNQFGVVEYINGIAPGVFVVIESDQPVVVDTMRYLKMRTGPHYLLYRPYHLTSLETPLSVARAVVYKEPTIIAGKAPVADTVAVSKRDLQPGDTLDGLGGFTVYGTIVRASESRQMQALPLGLVIAGTRVVRPVAKGSIVTYQDVQLPEGQTIVRLRKQQDEQFAPMA